MFFREWSFCDYTSEKIKNSESKAKNKKRAEMPPISCGSAIPNGHFCQRIRTNSYKFVQVRELCYFQ